MEARRYMDQTPDKLTSAKRPNTEDVTTRDHDADVQHAGQLREIREILERAKRLFKERRLAEARSEFILLIKLDTNNADGYYGLGILDLQSAENNFKCCTAVDPRNANAY